MMDLILDIDTKLFLFLNGLHAPWLDVVMYWITARITWVPFYLLIIILVIRRYGIRGLTSVVFIILAIILADQITSGFMKPFFQRLRPCHNPQIAHLVHLVSGCGGQFGFASGHAANSFALASGLFFFFKSNIRHIGWLFLWAALVSYSRIYIGVHYPLDVLSGGLIGFILGYMAWAGYRMLPAKIKP